MAASNPDIQVSFAWQDLIATYAGLASASAYVQNKGALPALVYFSASGSAPADASGVLVKSGDTVFGTAAHIWVRALNDSVEIQAGLTD